MKQNFSKFQRYHLKKPELVLKGKGQNITVIAN